MKMRGGSGFVAGSIDNLCDPAATARSSPNGNTMRMALALWCAGIVLFSLSTEIKADPLYVADTTGLHGLIGELDTNFNVVGSIPLPTGKITSVAAGPTGHVYATDSTHIYDFSSSGVLLNSLAT